MKEKVTYKNRKGTIYYFREQAGKRGTKIICSQKETEEDLTAIPETHEIVESANGQVSCRKKLKVDLSEQEIQLAQILCPKIVKKQVRVFVEIKKKALVLHSASEENMNEMAKIFMRLPGGADALSCVMELNLRYEPVFKLELSDKKERVFSLERMTWNGTNDWMFLDHGKLEPLLKKYVPHMEQESFFELY